jgi:hypothetical protein
VFVRFKELGESRIVGEVDAGCVDAPALEKRDGGSNDELDELPPVRVTDRHPFGQRSRAAVIPMTQPNPRTTKPVPAEAVDAETLFVQHRPTIHRRPGATTHEEPTDEDVGRERRQRKGHLEPRTRPPMVDYDAPFLFRHRSSPWRQCPPWTIPTQDAGDGNPCVLDLLEDPSGPKMHEIRDLAQGGAGLVEDKNLCAEALGVLLKGGDRQSNDAIGALWRANEDVEHGNPVPS